MLSLEKGKPNNLSSEPSRASDLLCDRARAQSLPVPIILSPHDRRVLAWFVAQVGETAVAEACAQLAGARRPYPSNIAKVLRLKPPSTLALTTAEDARRHLDSIRAVVARSGRTTRVPRDGRDDDD